VDIGGIGTIGGGEDRRYLAFSSTGLSTVDIETGVSVEPGIGFNGIVIGTDILNVVVRALSTHARSKVMSAPKLLVNDNQEGTITTEEKTAIVREKTDVIPGSAATAPTATTSVAFETFTAGITLTITPHISQGDQLQLKITMQRTDFRLKPDYTITTGTGTKSGPTPPDLLTSNVDTTVTVPNGKTIILGGLEKLNQGKGGTKVPLLGDLPLIGGLFRNTANTDNQSRLYVFVKAHILRPGEQATGVSDIELVSRENKDRFEKYEAEMQKYQDWPGFKPKPFEPVRVLESR